ncbi:hypothetical protein SNEBB_000973 [Seison nebaliae]|nr:hypothetical protein SNEBB_000973 [Seison nebaliae]
MLRILIKLKSIETSLSFEEVFGLIGENGWTTNEYTELLCKRVNCKLIFENLQQEINQTRLLLEILRGNKMDHQKQFSTYDNIPVDSTPFSNQPKAFVNSVASNNLNSFKTPSYQPNSNGNPLCFDPAYSHHNTMDLIPQKSFVDYQRQSVQIPSNKENSVRNETIPNDSVAIEEPPSETVVQSESKIEEKEANKQVELIPILQNIVSTVDLSAQLDLRKIAMNAKNAEYNPKRFAAVIMRIREPRTTALIFSSGKMVCTGAKSEEDSLIAARKYARIIQRLGFDVKFTKFTVQNMVGSVDVKFPVRLELLNVKHHVFTTYEPEIFPGLVYRLYSPKIVLLIFVSGKVVLTGAKKKEDINTAFRAIHPILKQFKKGVDGNNDK